MRTNIQKVLVLSLLTVYSVFSTGIFVSIHQCCSHCFTDTKVEVEYCECMQLEHAHEHSLACDDLYHEPGDGHVHADHHKCHDYSMLLKIIDNYDKTDADIPVDICLTLLYELDFSNDHYFLTLFKTVIKSNRGHPSLPVIQGDSFLDYSQQRLFYA